MNFICKPFDEFNSKELYRILKLRTEVFEVEQNCIYQDMDEKDYSSFHLLKMVNNEVIAYARLLPIGVSYAKDCSIGRVCTHSQYRNTGLGEELMLASIQYCSQLFSNSKLIRISAQSYLEVFYTRLGFQATGKNYLEDNIPHMEMIFEMR